MRHDPYFAIKWISISVTFSYRQVCELKRGKQNEMFIIGDLYYKEIESDIWTISIISYGPYQFLHGFKIFEIEFLFFWTIEVMAKLLLITCFDEFFFDLANVLLESWISITNGSVWNEESIQDWFISTDNLLTSFRFGLLTISKTNYFFKSKKQQK